jgi:Ca2+-binding EF-hand superfamily protein
MKKTFYLLVAATACSASMLAAVPAQAQLFDNKGSMLEKRFKMADKDSDGKLTRAEAEAGMPLIARNFDRIDTSKKGYLTLDEIKSAAKNR